MTIDGWRDAQTDPPKLREFVQFVTETPGCPWEAIDAPWTQTRWLGWLEGDEDGGEYWWADSCGEKHAVTWWRELEPLPPPHRGGHKEMGR